MILNIESAPRDPERLAEWLETALNEIVSFVNAVAEYRLEVISEAPAHPVQGLYFADGTVWDPGAGRGLYVYDEQTSTYTKL